MLPSLPLDYTLARILNEFGRGWLDGPADMLCAVPLLVGLWGAVVAAALRFDRRTGRLVAGAVLCALALHFLLSELLLKHVALAIWPIRVRPYLAHPDTIRPVGQLFTDSSFPSSHAASTAAGATVLAAGYSRAWPVAVTLVILMAAARVHNGMHYPTDVLAGSLLGVGYGLAAWALLRRRVGRPPAQGIRSEA